MYRCTRLKSPLRFSLHLHLHLHLHQAKGPPIPPKDPSMHPPRPEFYSMRRHAIDTSSKMVQIEPDYDVSTVVTSESKTVK